MLQAGPARGPLGLCPDARRTSRPRQEPSYSIHLPQSRAESSVYSTGALSFSREGEAPAELSTGSAGASPSREKGAAPSPAAPPRSDDCPRPELGDSDTIGLRTRKD